MSASVRTVNCGGVELEAGRWDGLCPSVSGVRRRRVRKLVEAWQARIEHRILLTLCCSAKSSRHAGHGDAHLWDELAGRN